MKEYISGVPLQTARGSTLGVISARPVLNERVAAQPCQNSKKGNSFVNEFMLRSSKLLSMVVTCVLFSVCYRLYYGYVSIDHEQTLVFHAAYTIYALLTLYFYRVYHASQIGIYRISELVYSQSLANLMSAGVVYVLHSILLGAFANPLPLGLLVCIQTLWNGIWSFTANTLYLRLYPPVKTIILYHRESELQKLRQIKDFSVKFDVQRCYKDPKDTAQLYQELEGYSAVFLMGFDVELRSKIVEYCLKNKIRGYIVPCVGDIILTGAKLMETYHIPIYKISRASPTPEYAIMKRLFDIVLSILGLIVTSPVMLMTALAIKLYDGGPVIYRQERLTRNGARFFIWKFRSMRVDAEKDGIARMACEHDNRITPVGKVIRCARIDELPQLFNILSGHMSLVGPRPERPEIAAQYEMSIPAFSLRLQVKAGLTGYAQVYGRYDSTPIDKLNMDLMYINSNSILEDIRLVFATLKILFLKDSTAGLKAGQTIADLEEDELMKRDSA